MQFGWRRQIFVSSVGSVIDQTRTLSGAGFSALSYKDDEIQTRSFPNSFGGQYQLKGYELVDELHLLDHAGRIAEEVVRYTPPISARKASSISYWMARSSACKSTNPSAIPSSSIASSAVRPTMPA